jgi:hypothetical protein
MTIIEAIRELLDGLDNNEGQLVIYVDPVSSCPVCMAGTVPDRLNRGLCAFHTLERAAAEQLPQVYERNLKQLRETPHR